VDSFATFGQIMSPYSAEKSGSLLLAQGAIANRAMNVTHLALELYLTVCKLL